MDLVNRLVNSIVAVLFALFRTSNKPLPQPVPPPLPPGVLPTPGPIIPPPPVPQPLRHPLSDRLATFAKQYVGKFVDMDNFAGAQCVDVQLAWCKWLGLPVFPGVPGAGWHAGMRIPGWVWIPNTSDNIPQQGDIVVWSRSPSLPWGHEGLFTKGDVFHLWTLDQNWPYDTPVHEQAHSYAGVAGWQRPLNWH